VGRDGRGPPKLSKKEKKLIKTRFHGPRQAVVQEKGTQRVKNTRLGRRGKKRKILLDRFKLHTLRGVFRKSMGAGRKEKS